MNKHEMNYEKMNMDFLDTLPLRAPEKGESVREYRYWAEDEFAEVTLPQELDECLFNWLNDEEIGEYLAKRFHMQCWEETNYIMR